MPANLMTSVFSLRGGVGTTTVAVNLALTLQQAGRQVCLVDLCQKSGHAAIQVRQQAKMTWADALLQINNLSPEALDQILLRHDSGLRVSASPFLPPVRPPAGEAIARLLVMLKAAFGATVVDLGTFDDAGRAAILSSDLVLLVLTPEVASLQTTAATLRTIKALNVPDDRVLLVSNQVALRPGLSPAAIEKALGRKLFANLPYDEAQLEALGRGVPLMPGQFNSPLATGVRNWSRRWPRLRSARNPVRSVNTSGLTFETGNSASTHQPHVKSAWASQKYPAHKGPQHGPPAFTAFHFRYGVPDRWLQWQFYAGCGAYHSRANYAASQCDALTCPVAHRYADCRP